MNYKKIFESIAYVLLLLFFTIFTVTLLQLVYDRTFIIISKDANFLVAFIVLGTSLVTGGFFLVKIYIENQLGIKEKEMIKEYEDSLNRKIKEQTEQQNLKFEEQNVKFSNLENNVKKLQEQNDEIINWINSQSKNK